MTKQRPSRKTIETVRTYLYFKNREEKLIVSLPLACGLPQEHTTQIDFHSVKSTEDKLSTFPTLATMTNSPRYDTNNKKPLGTVTKLSQGDSSDDDFFVDASDGGYDASGGGGYSTQNANNNDTSMMILKKQSSATTNASTSPSANEYVEYEEGEYIGGGDNNKLPPYPHNHPRRKRHSGRRHSGGGAHGGVPRKLKFDSSFTSQQICDLLMKAKENKHYHTLTFDEVTFDADICASVIDLLKHTALSLSFNALSFAGSNSSAAVTYTGSRRASYSGPIHSTGGASTSGAGGDVTTANSRDGLWQSINFEFCEGPTIYLNMIIQSIFVLDCVKHLFIASDDKQAVNEWLCNPFETSFRTSINLSSLWLLVPVSEKLGKSLGYGLTYNTTLDKLSFSGSTWERAATKSLMFTPDTTTTPTAISTNGVNGNTTEGNNDGNNPASRYVTGLAYNTTLKTLDLSCCNLKDHYISNILLGLHNQSSIVNLDISRNKCRELAMQELGQLLHLCECPIKNLDLREQIVPPPDDEISVDTANTMEEEYLDIKLLNDGLKQNDILQKLKLSHNKLRDGQVVDLARSLKGNRTLEELDLQYNLITDQGVSMFTSLVTEISGLRVLLLGGNTFGQEGQTELEKLQEDDDSVVTVSERDLQAAAAAGSTDDDDSSSSSSGEYGTTDDDDDTTDDDDLLVIDEGEEEEAEEEDEEEQQQRKPTPRAAETLLHMLQPNGNHRPTEGNYPNTLAEAFQSRDMYTPGPAWIEDL